MAYWPSTQFGFVNWDDTAYVYENTVIHSFSNLKELVTLPVEGNYHPVTLLSLAMNYALSGNNPFSYHLVNLLLHLGNIFLVYKFASRLSGNNNVIPFATAMLFGIHPMHVESVAWVSERKDVLYTFFFLLGLIRYLKYAESSSRRDYLISFLWFLLSLASKPAAIIFPLFLFTIDFFRGKKISRRLVWEKVPFLVCSALLTFLTLQAQTAVGATGDAGLANLDAGLGTRFFYGFYGYMMHFIKMLFPLHLSALYPFPPIKSRCQRNTFFPRSSFWQP